MLNGILVFRRTKSEPEFASELPERIDETDHCTMTEEQIGLYQAVLDKLVTESGQEGTGEKGRVLAAITQLKQICNHPAAFTDADAPLAIRVELGDGDAAEVAAKCSAAIEQGVGVATAIEILDRGSLERTGYKQIRLVDA